MGFDSEALTFPLPIGIRPAYASTVAFDPRGQRPAPCAQEAV